MNYLEWLETLPPNKVPYDEVPVCIDYMMRKAWDAATKAEYDRCNLISQAEAKYMTICYEREIEERVAETRQQTISECVEVAESFASPYMRYKGSKSDILFQPPNPKIIAAAIRALEKI